MTMKCFQRVLYLSALGLIFHILLVGCSGDPTSPDDKDIVAGVNLDSLFAAPTAEEIATIEGEWQLRNPVASEVTILDSGKHEDFSVLVLSHDVNGVTHKGAVIVPDSTGNSPLPVLVLLHGGDGGINLDQYLSLIRYDEYNTFDNLIVVVPSFRSEALTYGGEQYTSGGNPSPWDRDVDDALALIRSAVRTIPAADSTRIGVLGYSRGAGVGLLMGIRNPDIDLIVEYFGPTDFMGEYVREIAREALQGKLRDLPGLHWLNQQYLQPLKEGELSIDDVRLELIRRSAVYFPDRLPQIQIHHGTSDTIVAVSQAERLIEVMEEAGRTEPGFEHYLYNGGTHNPFSLNGSMERTAVFLGRLVED